MEHRFRSHGTTFIKNKSRGLVGAASVLALSALLAGSSIVVGCGDSGDDTGSGKGGGQSSAGSSGRSSTANGGNDEVGDAGAKTGSSGSKNEGGTANGGSTTNGGSANESGGEEPGSTGGASEQPGGAGLGTSDGITGTFEGTAHTHTFNAVNVPQQTKTVVIGASSAMYPLYNNWSIRFLPKLGPQDCTDSTGTEDVFITFGSQTDYNLNGTTAGGGSCTLNVTSITPNFEGTFSATLATEHGMVDVTDGAFRVAVGKF